LPVLWSGKPFMRKTLVKSVIFFVLASLLLTVVFVFLPVLIFVWLAAAAIFFVFYYYNKNAFTYFVTDKGVRVVKSWVFGNYVREITFDQIRDVRVNQGLLARIYDCGSVVFVTATGLEVGYVGGGVGVGGGAVVAGGGVTPTVVKGRGNMFWDVREPGKVREVLVSKLTEWREVFQQQKISVSLEKMVEKPQQPEPAPTETIVEKLEKLKKLLDEGAITEEEYKRAKKKLLE